MKTKPKYRIMACSVQIFAVAAMVPCIARADLELDDAESYFSKQEDEASKKPSVQDTPQQTEKAPSPTKNITSLEKLESFQDISVIQKRFLPKTGRFEAFAGIGTTLNDAFFIDLTANLRLGYYFTEKYGVEFTGLFINASPRQITDELSSRGVITTSLVVPKSYLGADFKYSPIYGKLGFQNLKIAYFDMYFSLGLGMTGTENGSEPSIHLGTGQIFALSKSLAFRWDFSWNFYQANSNNYDRNGNVISSSRGAYNNLFVLVGLSYFFPEAKYR